MNCPTCGLMPLRNQQFCRSCGTQLIQPEPGSVNRWMLWGLVLAFGGIIIALSGRVILHLDILTFVGVLTSLVGMFLIAAYPLLRRSGHEKRRVEPSVQPVVIAESEKTNKLLPLGENDFIPSVTENTTDLLAESVIKRADPSP